MISWEARRRRVAPFAIRAEWVPGTLKAGWVCSCRAIQPPLPFRAFRRSLRHHRVWHHGQREQVIV